MNQSETLAPPSSTPSPSRSPAISSSEPLKTETIAKTSADKFYLATWRWHFYSGLYVIPFLIILALTGLAMLWTNTLSGLDGGQVTVNMIGAPVSVSEQAAAAQSAVADGELVQYIAPLADDKASVFSLKQADDTLFISVDPYTATVLDQTSRENSWYTLFNNLHGSLLLGVTGDRMIEIAASLAIVLLATGVYLWWPRDSGWVSVLVPDLKARGRAAWKSWHTSVGMWISALLFVFLLSGLAWAGVWGGKLVQVWSTFPAEKWNAPLSDDTHVAMSHDGIKQVPWALEQTRMPASIEPLTGQVAVLSTAEPHHAGEGHAATTGSDAGEAVVRAVLPVTIDSAATFARTLGFDQRFQLNLPMGSQGVWTISRDSMSSDSTKATTDRTVHVDQYSGEVLADVRFEDYSLAGKAMAVGIGFHMGTLGIWNLALNTVFCLSVIFLCVSGTLMWWKRRPTAAGRLVAPPMPKNLPLWQGAAVTGLAISLFFPMAGLTLLAVLAIDYLLLSRVPALKRVLS